MRRHHLIAGFTLLEILVSIGVVAVLLAIAAPSLANARRSAVELKCRSNLSQCGRMVAMYGVDNHDSAPTMVSDSINASTDRDARIVYHEQRWYLLITGFWSGVSGLAADSEVYRCPQNRRGGFDGWNDWTDFELSAALYVRPDYFRFDASRDPVGIGARVQRLSDVVFPTNKIGAYESLVWHGVNFNPMLPATDTYGCDYQTAFRPGSVWFVDGHAKSFHAREALPAVDQSAEWTMAPFSTTENGIRGRDVP
jgi:prepilin-type N-terminal cleavage/methylation domain-containing protein